MHFGVKKRSHYAALCYVVGRSFAPILPPAPGGLALSWVVGMDLGAGVILQGWLQTCFEDSTSW